MGLPVVSIEEGAVADLVLFDPDGESTFTPEFMKSKSRNTPFINQTLAGSVDLVILGDAVLLDRA
jgi:dihydroorotase